MLKKYSVLVVSAFLMASTSGLGGCVAQTASTEEVTESLSGSLRPGEAFVAGSNDVTVPGQKNLRSAPIIVQTTPKGDPGFDPTIHVAGNPEPQPWSEPKRGPVTDGR